MIKSRKAQSTLEYIIIFTAIVAAVLVGGPLLKGKVQNMLTHAGTEAEDAVKKINF